MQLPHLLRNTADIDLKKKKGKKQSQQQQHVPTISPPLILLMSWPVQICLQKIYTHTNNYTAAAKKHTCRFHGYCTHAQYTVPFNQWREQHQKRIKAGGGGGGGIKKFRVGLKLFKTFGGGGVSKVRCSGKTE